MVSDEDINKKIYNLYPEDGEHLVTMDGGFDILGTDLKRFAEVVIDSDNPLSSVYTRDMCSGTVTYHGTEHKAVFFVFHSGNSKLLAYLEKDNGLSDAIARCRKERMWPQTLRTLIKYIYLVSGLPLGFCVLFLIMHAHFLRAALGFFMMLCLRWLYTGARNKLK